MCGKCGCLLSKILEWTDEKRKHKCTSCGAEWEEDNEQMG